MKLLVVDHSEENLKLVRSGWPASSIEVFTAADSETGLNLFFQERPAIVLVDLRLANLNGIEVMERILAADPAVEVILMTDHPSTESAVEAIQKGASNYLTKPLDFDRLRAHVEKAQAEARRRERTAVLDRELLNAYEFEGMIGRSPLMLEVFAKIRRIAPHFRTVLVTGGTGTGKELVAKALHRLSAATNKPFAVVNCAALVETLLESELFGYVKGAFTGALRDKVGVFEYADGGTVFLDEIGELPLAAQSKLLRVLQNDEIQRVGSPVTRTVNVRVIAATNRNLRDEIANGSFRGDLYYRLSMVEVDLPALNDRKDDVPLLERHILAKFARQYGKDIKGITRRAQAFLASHSWPGNVRELENVIGHACMMTTGDVIDVQDLPERLRKPVPVPPREESGPVTLELVQHRHVLKVLEHFGGNKARTADALGIGRGTLYEMLARIKSANVASISRSGKEALEPPLPQSSTG